jgi:hypothetical protein
MHFQMMLTGSFGPLCALKPGSVRIRVGYNPELPKFMAAVLPGIAHRRD